MEKKAFPEASSKGFEWGFCPYGGSRGQRERDLEFLSFQYTHDEKKPRNLTRVSTYVVVSISIMQYLPVFPSLVIACPSFPTGIPFAPGACWMPACLSTSLSKKNPVILHVHDFPSETVVFCFPLFFSKKEPIAGVIPSRVRRLKSGKSAERGEPLFPDWPVPFSLASNAAEQNSEEAKSPGVIRMWAIYGDL